MMRDIQIVVTIIVMIWFAHTARAVGKSSLWATIGALAYLIPNFLSAFIMMAIIRIIPSGLIMSNSALNSVMIIGFIGGSGIGLILVFWIYKTKLRSDSMPRKDTGK